DMVIVVEMDAKMVVDALKTKTYPRVYWGKIVQKGGELLSIRPNVTVTWVGRVGNRVAHNLAKWALVEPNMEWLSVVPPQIALFI
ncbi:TIR-NBS-LRR resistance protein, partial [Trifolium medium]|nr:TIR-NBS-LRR resistance protein [Trifolium medium]